MANVLGELFQDIADAIRSKTGSTDTLKPNEFPAAIEGITTGGGSSADVRYVTFRNESTGEEYKKPVAYGDDCVDVVAKGLWKTPTKESTAQYNYTFYGWGASDGGAADANILKNITEDKTVYAIFTATVRMYTITWLDEDGTELPGQKQWAYGTIPSYTPEKEGSTFAGWIPELTQVTEDMSYTATWLAKADFATLSWQKIAEYAESGVAADVFDLGAEKSFENSKYPQYPFVAKIVGFNHDDLSNGSGKAGITMLIRGYAPDTNIYWGTIADNTQFLNSSVYKRRLVDYTWMLPSDFTAKLKKVRKKYYDTSKNAYTDIDVTYCLPSCSELNFAVSGRTEEGKAYAAFDGTDKSRIIYAPDGTAVQEWTRTKHASTGYVYKTNATGGVSAVKQDTSNSWYCAYALVCI